MNHIIKLLATAMAACATITYYGFLTPVIASSLSQPDSATAEQTFYQCDFSNTSALLDWNETLNGGSVVPTGSSVLLEGTHETGLAGLTLRPGHFPTGDWTATICFRYVDPSAGFGSGVGFEDTNGNWVARVWAPWFVQVNDKVVTGVSDGTFLSTSGDTNWHMYSLVRKSSRLEVFMDGRDIGGCNFTGTISTIFLGGGGKGWYPDKWTQFELRFVRIDVESHVLQLTNADISYPQNQPSNFTNIVPAPPAQTATRSTSPVPSKVSISLSTPNSITLHQSAVIPPVTQPAPVPYFVPVYIPVMPDYVLPDNEWTYTDTDTYYY